MCSLTPMRQVSLPLSLPPFLPPPTVLELGAERRGTHAHAVDGERKGDGGKKESEKERALSVFVPPPLLSSLLTPAIQAEQTPSSRYYSFLTSSSSCCCIWGVHPVLDVDGPYIFWQACYTTVNRFFCFFFTDINTDLHSPFKKRSSKF